MQKSIHTRAYRLLRDQLIVLRSTAGLTQRELAHRLKVSPSWVAKTELGERRLDVLEFCRVTTACGAEPETVFAEFSVQLRELRHAPRTPQGRST